MPVGDVYGINLAGQMCGVPVAMGFAYKQTDEITGNDSPETVLMNAWFTQLSGPWRTIRAFLSNQLTWQCASITVGEETTSVYLTDAAGLNANGSIGSPVCIQMECAPEQPHPGKSAGRFFLPGLPKEYADGGGYTGVFYGFLRQFGLAMLNLQQGEGGPIRFQLVPHFNYLDAAGTQADILCSSCFAHPFMKIIGSRRADACTAFAASGGGGFGGITVPPEA